MPESDRRRVGGRHDAGDQRIVVELEHHHAARTGAVPEVHERRTAGQDAAPVRPSRLLLEVLLEVDGVQEAMGGVRRRGRVAEADQDLSRPGGQDLRGRQADLVDRAQPDAESQGQEQPRDDDGEIDEGRSRTEAGRLSGVGHDLRRRRLPRRESGGQGIAARERGRHREHRGWTLGRIALEAAQDRALDRGIQVSAPGATGSAGVESLRVRESLRQRLAFEGLLAGEDLVEHEARASRCRSGS